MKGNIIKSSVLVALVVVFAFSFVSPSEAQKNHKPIVLEGTYGLIGQEVCVVHWTTPPVAGAAELYWTKTSTMQGTAVFNADGTGTGEVDQVTITHPIYTPIPSISYWPSPGIAPLGSTTASHVSTPFTYKIDPPTRTISRTISDGSGTFIGGSLDGKTFTFTGFDTLGYVSLDSQTIVAASPIYNPLGGSENPIMTVIIYKTDEEGGGIYGIQDEMCQRIRSSVRIK